MVQCNGSGTSEDLFWKLDALQTFIRDLHWPEEEFGKHLEQRLKLMASDMIESCVKRKGEVRSSELEIKKAKGQCNPSFLFSQPCTPRAMNSSPVKTEDDYFIGREQFSISISQIGPELAHKPQKISTETCPTQTRIAFEVKLQKTSRSTDFRVPQSICTMFNVMVDAKAQSTKLCSMEMGQESSGSRGVTVTNFTKNFKKLWSHFSGKKYFHTFLLCNFRGPGDLLDQTIDPSQMVLTERQHTHNLFYDKAKHVAQEVKWNDFHTVIVNLQLSPSEAKFAKMWHQYHSKIDELIEETVKEMITLLVAKFRPSQV
ncbi:hypothetical protein P7K49_030897 [Saguinus oedipus]|uniref:MHD1 domain-containing protein n=1 Tax=Saguinus oedipus TaxID=9490 RepID=A0ABQ9U4N8_SAGOE|nr:hypothetical protein P7K49_030897 [Saguinus oedipus]